MLSNCRAVKRTQSLKIFTLCYYFHTRLKYAQLESYFKYLGYADTRFARPSGLSRDIYVHAKEKVLFVSRKEKNKGAPENKIRHENILLQET
jgi:hypothetical protein